MRFDVFLDSLGEESEKKTYDVIISAREAYLNGTLQDFVESREFKDLVKTYDDFVAESSAKSKTFAYWSMYIKMIGNFIQIV